MDEKIKSIISTNWGGHPADSPTKLIVFKRGTDLIGNDYYALIWQSPTDTFHGTYDIPVTSLGKAIVEKIRLQDPLFTRYAALYFNDFDLMKGIKAQIQSLGEQAFNFYFAAF
jgi:hypothetical protein